MIVDNTLTKEELEFCYYKRGNAGGFKTKLIETIFAADDSNRAQLAKAFPDLVEVVVRYGNERGYWQDLQDRFEKY
jgi:hypothetical protein